MLCGKTKFRFAMAAAVALLLLFTASVRAQDIAVPEAPQPPAQGQVELRLLTYNIFGGPCDDKRSADNFEQLVRRLRRLKDNYGFDVVALQEVHRDQADEIAKRLRLEYKHYYRTITCDNGSRGNAILSRYPIETTRRKSFNFQEDEGGGERRNVVGVSIRVRRRLVYIYTTHLTSKGRASNQPNVVRALQAGECVDFIDEALPPGDRAVIMGDFNAERRPAIDFSSNTYEVMTNKFRDAWAIWARGHGININDPDGFTNPTWNFKPPPAKRIDYIFLRKGSGLNVEAVDVLNTLSLSDHFPVFARISFN